MLDNLDTETLFTVVGIVGLLLAVRVICRLKRRRRMARVKEYERMQRV